MTFMDSWGTTYPEDAREYIKSDRFIDIDKNVINLANKITRMAKTTDDAILRVHAFIKSLPVAKITAIPSVPARKASEQVAVSIMDPGSKTLSYNKTILENALLRSVSIPARPATFTCTIVHDEPSIVGELPRTLRSLFVTLHHSTEVYVPDGNGSGKFKLKESWIPQSMCEAIDDRTCMDAEIKEWHDTKEIKDLHRVLSCTKLASSHDYPGMLAMAINALVTLRSGTQVIDTIDPA